MSLSHSISTFILGEFKGQFFTALEIISEVSQLKSLTQSWPTPRMPEANSDDL